jgi:hypothetical protein
LRVKAGKRRVAIVCAGKVTESHCNPTFRLEKEAFYLLATTVGGRKVPENSFYLHSGGEKSRNTDRTLHSELEK